MRVIHGIPLNVQCSLSVNGWYEMSQNNTNIQALIVYSVTLIFIYNKYIEIINNIEILVPL
jgi:hypothetical protein